MPQFCYKYLKEHVIYNTIIGFPFLTIYDLASNKLLNFFGFGYQLFAELIQYFSCISSCVAVILYYNDLDKLCVCLTQLFYTGHIILKRIHFKILKKKYKNHLDGLEEILKNNDNFNIPGYYYNFEKYFDKKSRFIRFLLKYNYIGQILFTMVFYGESTYYWLTQPVESLVPPFPFERTNINYHVVYLSQMVAFFYINTSMVVEDYFVMDVILLHSAQIEFLDEVLTGIIKCSNSGVLSNKEREECLDMWIKQHQETYKYSVALREIIGSFIMIEYSFVLTFGCTDIFVVFSTTTWEFSERVSVFGMFGLAVVALLQFSHIGNRLETAVSNLGRTFYGCWLLSWKKLKTEFLLYTQLHNEPFLISYHLILPLGFPTASMILRLVLSYYMALQEFQDMKDE